MYVLENLILFVVVGCCFWSRGGDAAEPRRNIPVHEVMTEADRVFYFGIFEGAVPEYQIVYLPAVLPPDVSYKGSKEDLLIEYSFSALGREFNLELKLNRMLLSPDFKVYSNSVYGLHHDTYLTQAPSDCHYLHERGQTVAGISNCKGSEIRGSIVDPNSTYEIIPLSPALAKHLRRTEPWPRAELAARKGTHPHIVRYSLPVPYPFVNDYLPRSKRVKRRPSNMESDNSESANQMADYTLEVAIFIDKIASNAFYNYFNNNETEVKYFMLAYMNQVQALYHHPTLGIRLDIIIVRCDFYREQPTNLLDHNGEIYSLLDSFCAYQAKLNVKDDADPDHWDMALYLSGLDFFEQTNGTKMKQTTGVAKTGGVCNPDNNCVVTELATTNDGGKPYASAGFTSAYILAHEIGHNLGLEHDNEIGCTQDGYIMSPSRDTNGEATWSTCSARDIKKLNQTKCLKDRPTRVKADLDHTRYRDAPGAQWSAKRQCEILLLDPDAVSTGEKSMSCEKIECQSKNRAGHFYAAGPALQGTACGVNMWCQGGACVRREVELATSAPATWSAWVNESCASACISNASGYRECRRRCSDEMEADTCPGIAYNILLCDDEKLCAKRLTKEEYARSKCSEFSAKLPELNLTGSSTQLPYDEERKWACCELKCDRVDPKECLKPNFAKFQQDNYFPDGTPCHTDDGKQFYCNQHRCLPEGFESTEQPWFDDDIWIMGNGEADIARQLTNTAGARCR